MDTKEVELKNVSENKLLKSEEFQEVVYKPTTFNGPLKSDEVSETKSGFLYVSAFTVNLLAFAAGVSFSWSSPVIPKLDGSVDSNNNPLPEPIGSTQASWIAGILCLGAAIGPVIAGKLADIIGRKNTLLSISFPITFAYLVLGYTSNVNIFYVARFIKGLGVGASFAVLPMYLGEIAEDRNRGTIGCLMGVFISLGLLYSYVIGPFLTVKLFCFACTLPLILFFFSFYLFIPDSPVHLAAKGNKNAAQQALMKLRSKSAVGVQQELSEIVKNIDEANASKGGVTDLFISRGLRKAFIICCGILLLQQLSGINVVLAYMQTIFDAAGGSIPADISTVIIGVIQTLTTVATSVVVEKLGKKILIVISTVGSCLSVVVLGIYFFLQQNEYDLKSLSWLPVACLIGYIIAFNLGLGPLPWAILGELFPANVKSVASTLNSCICFLASFLITLFFPILSSLLGMAQTFWLFGGCCVFGLAFVIIVLPETKGKTFSEIQSILSK